MFDLFASLTLLLMNADPSLGNSLPLYLCSEPKGASNCCHNIVFMRFIKSRSKWHELGSYSK